MLQGNSENSSRPEPDRVVLKKYGKNRRLYDTSASRYVNLDEVAALIRNGVDVQVVDAKSGEDLTRLCLMQIVMEDAKQKPAAIPLELLRQLIIASDHVGREFIMWYMQSAFDTYRRVQSALESGLTEVHSAARSPLQLMKNFIQSATAGKETEESKIQELRDRIAELEARQKKSRAPRKKRGKSAKSGAR